MGGSRPEHEPPLYKRHKSTHGPQASASQPDLDPFDESNFVEKKVAPRKQQQEEAKGWDEFTKGTIKAKKEPTLKADPFAPKAFASEATPAPDAIIASDAPAQSTITYEIGDRGSNWRMMKLHSLRDAARDAGREVEDLAQERYGSLEKYDEAREEEQELARRKKHGIQKKQPDGSLYKARLARDHKHDTAEQKHESKIREEIKADEMVQNGQIVDVGHLNALKAKLLKAQLKQSPDLEQLQNEYEAAVNHYNSAASADIVVEIPGMDTRGEALQKHEDDMTIEELVREEKREARMMTQSRRDADRIARDSRFKTDLDYQDENADRLAARIKSKEVNLKNASINDFQRINKILDNCPLCHKDDGVEPPIAPVISLGTRTFLSLPSAPLTRYHCLIVPTQHRINVLECDEDEQQEIRNFMKSLTRLYDSLGYSAMFYENNARPQRKSHCAIECIPIPHDMTDNVPRFWEEALNSADEQWAQHRPIIKTDNNSFHRKMSSAMPYFHVWFDLNGGMGHVIEDDRRWPKDDLFGREVVASILGLDVDKWRRKGTWTGDANSKSERDFKRVWDRWDWTKALIEK